MDAAAGVAVTLCRTSVSASVRRNMSMSRRVVGDSVLRSSGPTLEFTDCDQVQSACDPIDAEQLLQLKRIARDYKNDRTREYDKITRKLNQRTEAPINFAFKTTTITKTSQYVRLFCTWLFRLRNQPNRVALCSVADEASLSNTLIRGRTQLLRFQSYASVVLTMRIFRRNSRIFNGEMRVWLRRKQRPHRVEMPRWNAAHRAPRSTGQVPPRAALYVARDAQRLSMLSTKSQNSSTVPRHSRPSLVTPESTPQKKRRLEVEDIHRRSLVAISDRHEDIHGR